MLHLEQERVNIQESAVNFTVIIFQRGWFFSSSFITPLSFQPHQGAVFTFIPTITPLTGGRALKTQFMHCKLSYCQLLLEAVSIQSGKKGIGHVYVRIYKVSLCVHMHMGLHFVYSSVHVCTCVRMPVHMYECIGIGVEKEVVCFF